MYETCIQNFLNVCDPRCVERHSDSSEFENPSIIPVVTPKDGNHSLLRGKVRKCIAEQDYNNDHLLNGNIRTYERHLIQCTKTSPKTKPYDDKSNKNTTYTDTNDNNYKTLDNPLKKEDKRNRGDQKGSSSESNSKSLLKNKILPCLSTILRRTSNSSKPLNSTDNNFKNISCGKNKLSISNCNQKQKTKRKKRCNNKMTQPVYNVNEINGFPLLLNETYISSKRKDTNTRKLPSMSCSESSICTSEKEVKSFKYDKNSQRFKTLSKCISKDKYSKGGNTRDKNSNCGTGQQLNMESRIKKPYQIFTSSCQADVSCNSKCVSAELGLSKLESDSSVFWNFLVEKLLKKYPTKKLDHANICECLKPLPCTPQTCKRKDNSMITEDLHEPELNLTKHNLPPILPANSPLRVAPPQITSGRNIPLIRPSHSSPSVKSSKEEKVECQCYFNKRKKNIMSSSKEMLKPCQEEHDVVTKAVADKYHGEILCVHNPKCILINGCLNMPAPQNMGQSNFWPVTQHKKSNFVQMCRKMKRCKQKHCEQASQYNPPYTELEQCLPEFKAEKIVQSACNHEPACKYIRSCHKPQFDPELINSCIHVPMCKNLVQTMIEQKPEKLNLCTQEPKRKERTLLHSRRHLMLSAKKSTSTQAKTEMVCQHDPPCIKIPTCLAQMICMDNNPFEIKSRYLHDPLCETIATSLKKVAREYIIPVNSQNSSTSCRIV